MNTVPLTFVTSAARMVPISQRVNLVPVDSARMALGLTADEVFERIESGAILWAFDLSTRPHNSPHRTIRIWADELADPATVAGLELPEVIGRILGDRPAFTRAELGTRWILSRFFCHRLVKLGLPEHDGKISRQDLEAYLATRWMDAAGKNEGEATP